MACLCAGLLGTAGPGDAGGREALLWGANIGPQLTGAEPPWDWGAVAKFEQMLGDKRLSILHFGSPFSSCWNGRCSYYAFPTKMMRRIRASGEIPFFSWSSESAEAPEGDGAFQLSDIIDGRYDAYIRSFARAARRWGHPFFLRFDWEMNGNWFPWSERADGNARGQYVEAWRHVHDIFTSVGATNANWVWCPNVDPRHVLTSLRELYPGDAYVDWTCLDGYNWGTAYGHKWQSFAQLFGSSYRKITESIAPSKPMIIGEVASSAHGGSKADWVSKMLSELPTRFPDIHGLMWFERYDNGMDWPLESTGSGSAVASFARGISAPVYVANQFRRLDASPIPAP